MQWAPVQTPLAHEALGAYHDERGSTAEAVERYGAFADAWAGADPEFQPRVRRARQRIAALGG